jgi:hypothetical protein
MVSGHHLLPLLSYLLVIGSAAEGRADVSSRAARSLETRSDISNCRVALASVASTARPTTLTEPRRYRGAARMTLSAEVGQSW